MIISNIVSLINYDVRQRIESCSLTSNDDSNWFGPARVSLPHDICRSRTSPEPIYINPHWGLPKHERFALPESTVLYLPAPLLADS